MPRGSFSSSRKSSSSTTPDFSATPSSPAARNSRVLSPWKAGTSNAGPKWSARILPEVAKFIPTRRMNTS